MVGQKFTLSVSRSPAVDRPTFFAPWGSLSARCPPSSKHPLSHLKTGQNAQDCVVQIANGDRKCIKRSTILTLFLQHCISPSSRSFPVCVFLLSPWYPLLSACQRQYIQVCVAPTKTGENPGPNPPPPSSPTLLRRGCRRHSLQPEGVYIEWLAVAAV